MGKMSYYTDFWGMNYDICPCDVHVTDYLEARNVKDANVFHFGTGTHHHVGIRCHENGSGNRVLGITASVEEAEAYVKLAIERPEVSKSYKAFFGDIYVLEPKLLPNFDAVALVHLCEFRAPAMDEYGGYTDRQLIDLFTEKLNPGGHMIFYTKSMAWDRAQPVVEQWAKDSGFEKTEEFKTLAIYRKNK
ncbi:MAG: hypothetical protein AB7O79_11665 [Xanthobacteraceae bacterium]